MERNVVQCSPICLGRILGWRFQANALIERRRGDPEAVPGAGSILGCPVGFHLRLPCSEVHHMDNGI